MTSSMDADSKKPKSKHADLAQKILDVARERGLQPGDRLAEQALASACNVSRTPIRKALQVLAEHDMVRTESDGGYVLAKEPAGFELMEESGEDGEIYASILRDLSAGRIGDSQTVASLQRRYSASRTAVQNALIKLSDNNLAERAPGQQWLLKQYGMSADAVARSFEFRLACEPLALSLPGFKRDSGALLRLRQVMEQLRLMGEQAFDVKLFERIDFEFHTLIARNCGNPFLGESLASHHRQRRTSLPVTHVNAFRLVQSNNEHIQIVEQIERGQYDLAADLMRVHLQLSHAQRPRLAGRGVPQLFKVAG